jgi:hypothetical protein
MRRYVTFAIILASLFAFAFGFTMQVLGSDPPPWVPPDPPMDLGKCCQYVTGCGLNYGVIVLRNERLVCLCDAAPQENPNNCILYCATCP